MNKYNFSRVNDNTLNIRMDKYTADAIRVIAKQEKITMQEVCRTFLQVAVKDYFNDQPEEGES